MFASARAGGAATLPLGGRTAALLSVRADRSSRLGCATLRGALRTWHWEATGTLASGADGGAGFRGFAATRASCWAWRYCSTIIAAARRRFFFPKLQRHNADAPLRFMTVSGFLR